MLVEQRRARSVGAGIPASESEEASVGGGRGRFHAWRPFSTSAAAARMAPRMQAPKPVFGAAQVQLKLGLWRRGSAAARLRLPPIRSHPSPMLHPQVFSATRQSRMRRPRSRYQHRHRVTPHCASIFCRDAGRESVLRRGAGYSKLRDRHSCGLRTEASRIGALRRRSRSPRE